jgi:serpin B
VLDAFGLAKARHAASAPRGIASGALLSQGIERAVIEVDEDGAEAAAATAVASPLMLGADDRIHRPADKPFVHALRDKATRLVLIAG